MSADWATCFGLSHPASSHEDDDDEQKISLAGKLVDRLPS